MTWLLMCTGREHHFRAGQHPDNVPSLYEIGHSLARINRYTGHASRAYSVAEHSMLVADMCKALDGDPLAELCGLMHDAHECITGDVASPIKGELGHSWHSFEARQQDGVLWGYGLQAAMRKHMALVKFCDLTALATERRDLLPFDAAINVPWPVIDANPGDGTPAIEPWKNANLMEQKRINSSAYTWSRSFQKRATDLLAKAGIERP